MNYDDIWLRNQVTNIGRDLADLKATVDFQRRVLEMHAARIADLREEAKAKPKAEEVTAADAYRKSIEVVESMKGDFWTRNIPNADAKKWVTATIEDIVRILEYRLSRCEGKL